MSLVLFNVLYKKIYLLNRLPQHGPAPSLLIVIFQIHLKSTLRAEFKKRTDFQNILVTSVAVYPPPIYFISTKFVVSLISPRNSTQFHINFINSSSSVNYRESFFVYS